MSDPRTRRERARARRGGCTSGKVRYRDDQEAKRALDGVKRNDDARPARHRTPSRAYECDSCHGWHLSSHDG